MNITRSRRSAGMIAAGALVAGTLGALPASTAHAAEVDTDYTCVYAGSHAAALSLDVAAPAQVVQGTPITLTADASFKWGESWSNAGRNLNMKFEDVTATIPVLVNGTPLGTPATLTFADADVVVPEAGTMTWPAQITVPPIPTTSGADVAVTLGALDFDMRVALTFSGGNFVDAEVPCAVTGTAPTIASVAVTPKPAPPALAPGAALKVAGKPAVGQRLTARGGTTTPASSVAYRWTVGGKAAGAGASYVVKPRDLGKAVAVTATATKPGYTSRASTVTVGKVAAGKLAVRGKAKVAGKARVGKKLTAKPGKAAGTKVSYQWLSNGKAIKKAKGKKLKLKKAHRGKRISVKVTYKKAGYKTVVQKSKAVKVKR